MNSILIHYHKFNEKNKYRLTCYNNYNEHRGYYVLTVGKYNILYASISFMSMIKFIKDNNIPYYSIHLNNMTLDDLANYCYIDDRW